MQFKKALPALALTVGLAAAGLAQAAPQPVAFGMHEVNSHGMLIAQNDQTNSDDSQMDDNGGSGSPSVDPDKDDNGGDSDKGGGDESKCGANGCGSKDNGGSDNGGDSAPSN